MTIIKVAENSPAAMRVPKSSFRYFVPGNCGGPLLETDGVLLNPVEPSSLTFWLDIVTGKDKQIKNFQYKNSPYIKYIVIFLIF